MKLPLPKVSGDSKNLGCKKQQKREIPCPLKGRCPNATNSLRAAGLLGWTWMSERKSAPAQKGVGEMLFSEVFTKLSILIQGETLRGQGHFI